MYDKNDSKANQRAYRQLFVSRYRKHLLKLRNRIDSKLRNLQINVNETKKKKNKAHWMTTQKIEGGKREKCV